MAVALLLTLFARSDVFGKGAIAALTANPFNRRTLSTSGSWVLAVALLLALFARSDIGRNELIACVNRQPIQSMYIKYVRVMGFGGCLALGPFCSL